MSSTNANHNGRTDRLRFIDLFAGLGGFHLALRDLGHLCVFASEIDETLQAIYEMNFGMRPAGDIRDIDADAIPPHDILCAGFPCQPFSKAGSQEGLSDPELGGLYKDILRIVQRHFPRYIILENVPNLQNHDRGKTWEKIKRRLQKEGYNVALKQLSPHKFGIPQIRERIYIVASTESLDLFEWPAFASPDTKISIKTVLDRNPTHAKRLPRHVEECLKAWQNFLNLMPRGEKIPHPLWSMEFGATYPFEDTTPSQLSTKELRRFRGSHGLSLRAETDREKLFSLLPSHARRSQASFPAWKIEYIRRNREFYKGHKPWLDKWIPKILPFPSSFQKLEWNCQGEKSRRLYRYVIQFRASGVRVKRPTTAPSLVAMTSTQVPIIGWERRYMTPTECMRLQSMDELKYLPNVPTSAYQALGNAVNAKVARLVAENLIGNAQLKASVREPRMRRSTARI